MSSSSGGAPCSKSSSRLRGRVLVLFFFEGLVGGEFVADSSVEGRKGDSCRARFRQCAAATFCAECHRWSRRHLMSSGRHFNTSRHRSNAALRFAVMCFSMRLALLRYLGCVVLDHFVPPCRAVRRRRSFHLRSGEGAAGKAVRIVCTS